MEIIFRGSHIVRDGRLPHNPRKYFTGTTEGGRRSESLVESLGLLSIDLPSGARDLGSFGADGVLFFRVHMVTIHGKEEVGRGSSRAGGAFSKEDPWANSA